MHTVDRIGRGMNTLACVSSFVSGTLKFHMEAGPASVSEEVPSSLGCDNTQIR
ncbi:hypothetical protein BAUCODRAFT_519337 [Baudoinia panamericana UAMH 10762]|uniref:Uncharacterized protein n=1 Tax=Baudoinia panamericana (strain UAMH 10762) TaxID=717646 RepID=M2MTS1_BAUPA|nr:uncharacterized protein BAUCODRAFT_519337 [Baudoinia panamericana UAMH 10762]EMC94933.1 hypothetical protein BAUCODRAFT_519337 [Baudoinia panamericana UAMH 10762]